jgi:predicted acylesterase/phospholipase RssA
MAAVNLDGFDHILGAGGIKGFAHLGSLRAFEELQLVPVRLIGVSIGSAVATLYTNGFKTDQIREILLEEMRSFDTTKAITDFLRSFNPCRLWRQGGIIELHSRFEKLVVRYGLKPQPNLGILAYDLGKRKPVLFEGTDYDLAAAVSGSCSVPLLMQTTSYGRTYPANMHLVDGGVFHPCPVQFSPRPAVVCRLGMASQASKEKLPFYDQILHAGERFIRRFWEGRFRPSRPGDVMINIGKPDVGTLTFNVGEKTMLAMEQYGYDVTRKALEEALASGKLKRAA